MGKVAADSSHKWVYREPVEHEISFLSPWQGSLDPVSLPSLNPRLLFFLYRYEIITPRPRLCSLMTRTLKKKKQGYHYVT
jgi:hypothetical protein